MTENTIRTHISTYFDTNADISVSMDHLYNTFSATVIEDNDVIFIEGTYTNLDVSVDCVY